jgi:hypothetical protein
MSESQAVDTLINRLSRELRPVRRLAPPWARTALWMGAAMCLAAPLSYLADFRALAVRLMAVPDMWLSELGAFLTAVTAAYAAFLTSVPGRSRLAPLIPVPAVFMWISASTVGCLRLSAIPGTVAEPMMHPVMCLNVLLLVSVPLGVLLTWFLARAYPLRPGLTAGLAGLASAGAAACLLSLIHPYDATAEDLIVHFAAVLVVVAVTRVFGGRWIARREKA